MKLPALTELQRDEGRLVVGLALPADLDVFRGHFPGAPILAGVAQIDWAVRIAARHFPCVKAVARNFQIKFSNVIHPGMPLVLALTLDGEKGQLAFEYSVDGTPMSSGRIKIESAS